MLIRHIDLKANHNQIERKMKTFNYLVHFILATLLFGLTACASVTDDRPIDEDICRDPAFANFDKEFYKIPFSPYLSEGDIVNYDPDLRFLAFGEHAGASEGMDEEPIGGLTIFYQHEPEILFLDRVGREACSSTITSATMSTTDARIGTAEELNGKLYQLADDSPVTPCPAVVLPKNTIEVFYVSSGRVRGVFCASMQQVSPGSGEPFLVWGSFAIRN